MSFIVVHVELIESQLNRPPGEWGFIKIPNPEKSRVEVRLHHPITYVGLIVGTSSHGIHSL